MKSDDYDAELRHWWRHRINGFLVVVGTISGDRKSRWSDGRIIHTSVILSRTVKEGEIVQTMNSRYLLVGPENREAAKLMPSSSTSGWEAVLGPSHRIQINRRLNAALRRQIDVHNSAGASKKPTHKTPRS